MEFDENNTVEVQDEDGVEIYSRRAVFWFFMLLGPLFGCVLLIQNLKEAGYRKAVNSILIFTVLFDIISELILVYYVKFNHIDLLAYQQKLMAYKPGDNIIDENIVVLLVITLGLRIIGAFIITRYFFKKYFPDKDYYPKSIANIMFISILVWIVLQIVGLGGI